MLEVKSPFAHRDEIDPEVLMRKNSELPLATTALAVDLARWFAREGIKILNVGKKCTTENF